MPSRIHCASLASFPRVSKYRRKARRSSQRKADRPSVSTMNGSGSQNVVQAAGMDMRDRDPPRKKMVVSLQFRRTSTNGIVRPNNG